MIKRTLLIVILGCASLAYAAETTPSEASIREMLALTNARTMVESMMGQVDGMITNMMQQATQGQPVSPQVQAEIDKARAEAKGVLSEMLEWNKLEPMYIRIYQQSFNQEEVDGMLEFYKTPAGQAVIKKMPVVMQNTMTEMQTLMAPAMQRMQQKQQEIVKDIAKERGKKS